jgi:hypothetical protein
MFQVVEPKPSGQPDQETHQQTRLITTTTTSIRASKPYSRSFRRCPYRNNQCGRLYKISHRPACCPPLNRLRKGRRHSTLAATETVHTLPIQREPLNYTDEMNMAMVITIFGNVLIKRRTNVTLPRCGFRSIISGCISEPFMTSNLIVTI